jgi:Universal stress protein family
VRDIDGPEMAEVRLSMTELSEVLCAVDFSEPAQVAFTRALALCAEQDGNLTVVHAVPPDQRFRSRGRERMNAQSRLHRLAERKDVRLRVRVQQGEPGSKERVDRIENNQGTDPNAFGRRYRCPLEDAEGGGDKTVGGSTATPARNDLDAIGEAIGVLYARAPRHTCQRVPSGTVNTGHAPWRMM